MVDCTLVKECLSLNQVVDRFFDEGMLVCNASGRLYSGEGMLVYDSSATLFFKGRNACL